MKPAEERFFFSKQALKMLRMAEEELQRPSESVVVFSACQSSKGSALEFLKVFLRARQASLNAGRGLQDLIDRCSDIDAAFRSIDISCFSCRHSGFFECQREYCLSLEHVHQCHSKAQAIKELVMAKLKMTESDLD